MASQNNRPKPKKTGMSKKKKIITIVVAAVLAVALIAGIVATVVLSNWEEYKQYAADRKTVAICNGFEVPYEELYFVTMFYKDSLADTYGEERMIEQVSLRYAIEQLPEKEKKAIYLRYFHGMTQESASRVLGVSQVQVSRLERRAIDKLREVLTDTC